ncbi:hypothetical protein MBLNU459_g5816t1 [Dothideomycetes sp. NU459]
MNSKPTDITEAQLPTLASLCERPSTSGVSICPLCTENQWDCESGFQQFRQSSNVAIGGNVDQVDSQNATYELKSAKTGEGQEQQSIKFNENLEPELYARLSTWISDVTEDVPDEDDVPIEPSEMHTMPSSLDFVVESSKLKRHMAQHMERLALFAIPLGQTETEQNESVDTGQAAPHSQSSTISSTISSNLSSGFSERYEGETQWQQELEWCKNTYGLEHPATLAQIVCGGRYYDKAYNYFAAEDMYRQAMKGYEKILGREHLTTLETTVRLGNNYASQGKFNEAEEIYRRAVQGYEKIFGREHQTTLTAVVRLGDICASQGKLNEAEEIYRRAVQGHEKIFGEDHPRTVDVAVRLGEIYAVQGMPRESEEMYRRAVQGYENILGEDHPTTLDAAVHLGNLYSRQQKFKEAEELYQRAIEGYEKNFGSMHPRPVDTIVSLGKLFNKQGNLVEAEKMYRRALEGYGEVPEPEHPTTLESTVVLGRLCADHLASLASVYYRKGRIREANELQIYGENLKEVLGWDDPETRRLWTT